MWLIRDQLEGETAGKNASNTNPCDSLSGLQFKKMQCNPYSNKNLGTHEVMYTVFVDSLKKQQQTTFFYVNGI